MDHPGRLATEFIVLLLLLWLLWLLLRLGAILLLLLVVVVVLLRLLLLHLVLLVNLLDEGLAGCEAGETPVRPRRDLGAEELDHLLTENPFSNS